MFLRESASQERRYWKASIRRTQFRRLCTPKWTRCNHWCTFCPPMWLSRLLSNRIHTCYQGQHNSLSMVARTSTSRSMESRITTISATSATKRMLLAPIVKALGDQRHQVQLSRSVRIQEERSMTLRQLVIFLKSLRRLHTKSNLTQCKSNRSLLLRSSLDRGRLLM